MEGWDVRFHPAFVDEFRALDRKVKIELGEVLDELREKGPKLGRPDVDTLKGSAYANMKEIRFKADDGVWRFAFAFDPRQKAVILCGGDKSGVNEQRFYRALIAKADARFKEWLEHL